MISLDDMQRLLREHGTAKQKLAVGDQVLGVGTSMDSKFIEHAEVITTSDSMATLRVIVRIYIDSGNQPIGTWYFSKGQDTIVPDIPIDHFYKSIEERLLEN